MSPASTPQKEDETKLEAHDQLPDDSCACVRAENGERQGEKEKNCHDGLCRFLLQLRPTSQLGALGKVTLELPRSTDLRGTFGIAPGKLHLLLNSLPVSVEELELDAVAVKGSGLPLFLQFLRRLGAAREKGGSMPRLKRITFASNLLGLEGIGALSEEIRTGRASSLLALNLEETGIEREELEVLCKALEETRLSSVRAVNLSGNQLGHFGPLVSALSVSCLPCLQALILRDCGLTDASLKHLADLSSKGIFSNLRTLDLGGRLKTVGEECFLDLLTSALNLDNIPQLRHLRVCLPSPRCVSFLLNALRENPSSSSLEDVQLQLYKAYDEDLRALAAGDFPSVRTLSLQGATTVVSFLRGLLDRQRASEEEGSESGGCQLEALDVNLGEFVGHAALVNEALGLLGAGIEAGLLSFLRTVKVEVQEREDEEEDEDDEGGGGNPEANFFLEIDETGGAFFRSLSTATLPVFSELIMPNLMFLDEELLWLAAGIKAGNLPALRVLDFKGGVAVVEGLWLDALVAAVVESREGLRYFEKFLMNVSMEGGELASSLQIFQPHGKLERLFGLLPSVRHLFGQASGLGSTLIAGKLRNLTEVRLSGHTDVFVGGLTEGIRAGAFFRASVLDLGSPGEESWRDLLRAVVESERGLPFLKRLETPGRSVHKLLAVGSGKLPALEYMRDSEFDLDEQTLPALCTGVRRGTFPPGLPVRSVRFCRQDGLSPIDLDPLICALAESTKGLPACVSSLELVGGRLGVEALVSLTESGGGSLGSKLSQLESLDLSECEIDDERLTRLGEVFRAHSCTHLETLYLWRNRISAEGVSAFVDRLNPDSLPNLQRLYVSPQEEGGDSRLLQERQEKWSEGAGGTKQPDVRTFFPTKDEAEAVVAPYAETHEKRIKCDMLTTDFLASAGWPHLTENEALRKLVKALDPRYDLPSVGKTHTTIRWLGFQNNLTCLLPFAQRNWANKLMKVHEKQIVAYETDPRVRYPAFDRFATGDMLYDWDILDVNHERLQYAPDPEYRNFKAASTFPVGVEQFQKGKGKGSGGAADSAGGGAASAGPGGRTNLKPKEAAADANAEKAGGKLPPPEKVITLGEEGYRPLYIFTSNTRGLLSALARHRG
uniref:Uncharacterized protein n=1 Tax=Chromera velia CCMP2878 TaxID=1169474 RepID=A0A0G4GKE5_9ALVE|eukprot:Cvel_4824.t1-p1 / transcript=Cvel_4824.t1 / gene=Cvel_4824 / organism=Chromera_velia_CCMP2878 / gene_product=hypothetical protein / transcript_product=hypothetical protein / location=Cvel_scaffold217:64499-70994(-) / protein_length=1118 / sequence_SO=supercontig / SO=protein_coding / is_pseudo=false